MKPAKFLFKDKLDPKALYINPDKVKAQIVYEDIHHTGQMFPHIYGALNTDAAVKVVDFKPDFELSKFS